MDDLHKTSTQPDLAARRLADRAAEDEYEFFLERCLRAAFIGIMLAALLATGVLVDLFFIRGL